MYETPASRSSHPAPLLVLITESKQHPNVASIASSSLFSSYLFFMSGNFLTFLLGFSVLFMD